MIIRKKNKKLPFRSIADKSESLQEQYILRCCVKEKEKEKKEKKESIHMKYHEWMENNRKLTLSAQDDERLKSLLERDIQVKLILINSTLNIFYSLGSK